MKVTASRRPDWFGRGTLRRPVPPMRVLRRLAPAAFLLVAACRGPKDDASGGSTSIVPPPSSAPAPESPARRLALEPPRGSSPLDKQIEQKQALAKKLPKSEVWVTLGRLFVQKSREASDPGFYLNADACADLALEADPKSPLALGLKAQTALNDHRFGDAHDLAVRILQDDPENLVALGVDADALLELGKFEESVARSQRLVDLKPSLGAYTRVSYLRWLKGDFEGAKEAARLAVSSGHSSQDPEPLAWALVQAALLFWHKGDHEGALAGFDKALTALPGYPPALAGRGKALLSLGKPKEARDPLLAAWTKSPLVETGWLLADAEELSGDAAAAAQRRDEVVAKGRATDPRGLSLFLSAHERDPELALSLAEREAKKRGDVYTHDALGWALFRKGRLEDARAALDRANRLGTRDASLWFHWGAVKLAQGEKAAGKKLLRDALAQNPAFDVAGVREAKRLLEGAK